MITESFDRRTVANMEVALERACLLLSTGSEKHTVRRIIAGKIVECANRGDTTLSRLTEAGYAAAMQLSGQLDNSVKKKETANCRHRFTRAKQRRRKDAIGGIAASIELKPSIRARDT